MDNLKRIYYYLKDIFYGKEYDSNEDLNEAVNNTGLDKLEKIYSVILENNLNNNVINKENLINENEYDNIIIKHLLKTEDDEINEIIDESIKNQYIQNDSYKEYYSKIENLNHIQKYTIDKLKDNNFDSGLVCICTGGGKSLIILNSIQIFKNNYLEKGRSIMIFTERKNILLDLFFKLELINEKYEYIKKDMHWNVWKDLGYINLYDFNLINLVSIKKQDWTNFEKYDNSKTNLIIINRSFLVSANKYKEIKKELSPQLIIFDECHSITGLTVFKFLNYAKTEWNSKIIGFSATPIRNIKSKKIQNLDKLIEIFPNPLIPHKLHLIVNYNILNAIKDGICCPLNFAWFKKKSNLHNDKNSKKHRFQDIDEKDVDESMKMLYHHIDKLYFKKILCWTSTIKNSKLYKELFINKKEEFNKFNDISVYLDNSKKDSTEINDYENFYDAKDNSIMFCVAKHREGSDIQNLDCCIFLDKVENRSDVVWLQSIGRISRLAHGKDFGLVIDTFYEKSNDNECEVIIEKLIGYYMLLDSIALDTNFNSKKKCYEKAKHDIKLNNNDHTIQLGNINISCEGIDWNIFSENFDSIFDKMIIKKIKLDGKDRLDAIACTLKDKYNWNENTNFWEEYMYNVNKTLWNFPEDIFTEFIEIFQTKTWYQILDFKPLWFKNIKDIQLFFYENNINEINENTYKEWCLKDQRLPPYYTEWFRLDKDYKDINSFICNDYFNSLL